MSSSFRAECVLVTHAEHGLRSSKQNSIHQTSEPQVTYWMSELELCHLHEIAGSCVSATILWAGEKKRCGGHSHLSTSEGINHFQKIRS